MKSSELFRVIREARLFLDRHVNSNPPWVWIDSATPMQKVSDLSGEIFYNCGGRIVYGKKVLEFTGLQISKSDLEASNEEGPNDSCTLS